VDVVLRPARRLRRAGLLAGQHPVGEKALVTKQMPRQWIDFLFRRPRLTFVAMGALFLLFGVTSVNLFVLLKANIDLFLEYGTMVIADGALQQLVELLGSAYLSMVFYVLFKVCERVLVERLTAKRFGPRRASPRRRDAPPSGDDRRAANS
jgi:hypothetical protein